jgi:hypothetical protein
MDNPYTRMGSPNGQNYVPNHTNLYPYVNSNPQNSCYSELSASKRITLLIMQQPAQLNYHNTNPNYPIPEEHLVYN